MLAQSGYRLLHSLTKMKHKTGSSSQDSGKIKFQGLVGAYEVLNHSKFRGHDCLFAPVVWWTLVDMGHTFSSIFVQEARHRKKRTSGLKYVKINGRRDKRLSRL